MLLKNIYSQEFIENLIDKISLYCKDFNKIDFKKSIFNSSWNNLELKERINHISRNLNIYLPFDYKKQLEILIEVKKHFKGLEAFVFQNFVELFGLDNFNDSIKALEYFTIDSSSEFAIRKFILKYEDDTMKQMIIWANNENDEIRRLSCEGCRPRLPWGVSLPNFKNNPQKLFQIIEILKNDKSKYVQKSVANNLNDISKDNPSMVIDFVRKNISKSKSLDFICKHGSRTLLKQGNKNILELFNYLSINHIQIRNFACDEFIKIGDYLYFSFELISKKDLGNIRIEYVINYLKQNNIYNKKVFMIYQGNIKNKYKSFSKKQSFKNMTIRKHISGQHDISIVLNGNIIFKKEFILL